jgi:hypothetical protein
MVKDGIKTTEFLALVMLGLVLVANGSQHVNIDSETLNIFIAAVMAYIGQRGWVKTTAKKDV